MSFLLRQARRSTWSGEETVTDDRRAVARASFGRRPEDTDGISVFAVANDIDVSLVVAAIACTKREIGNIDMLRLEEDEVNRFGAISESAGYTSVVPANSLHRVLNWTPEKLAELVDHLLSVRRQSTRHNTAAVVTAILALNPVDVEEGTAREWVIATQLARGKR